MTARDEKVDIIVGLEAGANDYLAKPFDSGELCARITVDRWTVAMQEAVCEPEKPSPWKNGGRHPSGSGWSLVPGEK